MSEIDLSAEALQRRREIAEKATPGPWEVTGFLDIYEVAQADTRKITGYGSNIVNTAHIAANSPDAVIAMIAEIERLRKTVAWQAQELLARGVITDELNEEYQ